MAWARKNMYAIISLVFFLRISSVVNVDPPKPYGYATIYDWSFSSSELNQRNQLNWPAPSKCSPLQVVMAARHGSRNPTTENIQSAQSLVNRIQGKIQATQYNDLNSWTVPFKIAEQHLLVDLGRDEMEKMGIRFGSRFQSLFMNPSSEDFIFYSSDKSWTSESAASFRGGISLNLAGSSLSQSVQTRNDLLRYFTMCPKYTETVVNNPEWKTKQKEFEDGELVRNLRRTMASRLNLEGITELTFDELNAIYLMTVFEEGLEGSSKWSKVWQTREDLAVMEYIQDIREYYEWSYGYPITAEMACVLLKEMITNMDKAVSESDKDSSNFPKGVFAFGHTPSIVPLLTLLGFYKDDVAPSASNFPQSSDRRFHTHRVDRFGSNVALVTYLCDAGPTNESPPAGYEWPPNLAKYMVQVFLQEQPVVLPGNEFNLMPFESFRQRYAQSVDNCNLDKICGKSKLETQSEAAKSKTFNVILLSIISSFLAILL